MIADILDWSASRPAWMERALCASGDLLPADDWFAETVDAAKFPKRICFDCPVRQECLEYAFEIGDLEHGIYGGLTARERRALVRKGRAA